MRILLVDKTSRISFQQLSTLFAAAVPTEALSRKTRRPVAGSRLATSWLARKFPKPSGTHFRIRIVPRKSSSMKRDESGTEQQNWPGRWRRVKQGPMPSQPRRSRGPLLPRSHQPVRCSGVENFRSCEKKRHRHRWPISQRVKGMRNLFILLG